MRKNVEFNKREIMIDFILPWVDGSDKNWQRKFSAYNNNLLENDSRFTRYRDWDLLKYWFRGVECYAPWVNKIHFVTDDQIPDWLNIAHPKINIVDHKSYIPSEYLPTFSSHPIELNMHKINGLSENFVLFNDDVFIIDDIDTEDFFKDGLPCDMAVQNALTPGGIAKIILNDIELIAKNFSKKEVLRKNMSKWFNLNYGKDLFRNVCLSPWPEFSSFYVPHLAQPFLKSTLEKVWEAEYEVLHNTCKNKFRNNSDVNAYLFRFWHLCEGNFYPKSSKKLGAFHHMQDSSVDSICNIIKEKKHKIIAISDDEYLDFSLAKEKLKASFDLNFKGKSSYER